MIIVGFLLAILVGVSLGLIGSGGSILAVPILVYIMHVEPVLATAYSLFIVGTTALVGGIQNAMLKHVDYKAVFIFGIPSVLVVYIMRTWIVPLIPDSLFYIGSLEVTKSMSLMLLFAVVMMTASFSMIKPSRNLQAEKLAIVSYNYTKILIQGIAIGLLTGLVGVGGGFLIVPSLVLLARMPMQSAVGTSLFIIASNALIGFIGDLSSKKVIDWSLLLSFTGAAILGIFLGTMLAKKIPGSKLKVGFGWFVLMMGMYIIAKEVFK